MRHLLSAALLSLLLPISSAACVGSVVECGTDALELRRDFGVEVKDAGKPVPGVSVRVTNNANEELFSGVTAADGAVRVKGFAPGQYWLRTEILGMFAGGQCFRVGNRKSTKAKMTVEYDLADLAPSTRRMAGRLIGNQADEGGSPTWNFLHPISAPVSEAKLKLQDPRSGAAYTALSDSDGQFSFAGIPDGTYVLHIEGTYVLHIEGGAALGGREYDSTDLLIRLSDTAKRDTLSSAGRRRYYSLRGYLF